MPAYSTAIKSSKKSLKVSLKKSFNGFKTIYPLYIANSPVLVKPHLAVTNKYTLKEIAQVSLADEELIEKAITKGHESAPEMAKLGSFERKDILRQIASEIADRKEEFAQVLCAEAGKPINDSLGEIARSIETFEIAAEEATRIYGEYTPLDTSEANKGYFGIQKRFPVGLVSMISPFNFPMNLVAHKVAPAIAAGCPFVLKPSSLTPISAILLAEIMAKTALPKGAFSIVPCHSKHATKLVTDERINLLSFTGSPAVGWELKKTCGKKKIVLELGGNAACIVDQNIDVAEAVDRVVFGAFYQSGQSCISVQRIYVHENIYDEFKAALLKKTEKLVMGDPSDAKTNIGPLISVADVKRCYDWVKEAESKGAKILIGGKIDDENDNFMPVTILENVPQNCNLARSEVFGPICALEKYKDFKEAINKANDSAYGLQAGVFTNDLNKAFYAFDTLSVGGVVINDVPSKRIDSMPYGGIKDSGVGKEGIRYTIHSMTRVKLLLARNFGKM